MNEINDFKYHWSDRKWVIYAEGKNRHKKESPLSMSGLSANELVETLFDLYGDFSRFSSVDEFYFILSF